MALAVGLLVLAVVAFLVALLVKGFAWVFVIAGALVLAAAVVGVRGRMDRRP